MNLSDASIPLRVLITQSTLFRFAGSEIQTLELAAYLMEVGHRVTVYALAAGEPVVSEFSAHGIEVISSENNNFKLSDFDVIWVHHQVLPIGILYDLTHPTKYGANAVNHTPYFVFLHMSALRTNILEWPYTWNLEEYTSGCSMYVSEESRDAQVNAMNRSLKTSIYPNPAPLAFIRRSADRRKPQRLEKVLVVSNHKNSELRQAARLLTGERSIVVDFMGERGGGSELLSPEKINRYDLVISIGKTVQYCLVGGVPIFVYDRWGGCGYLDANNFSTAAHFNFSGRGFSKRSGIALAKEILEGYPNALKFQTEHREEFIGTYAINGVLNQLSFYGVLYRAPNAPITSLI